MSKAVGRPVKYNPSVMLSKIIALMKEGASKTEVAAELGISRDTLYDWCSKYVDFSDTIKRGELLSQAWWERNGRMNLTNREFNFTGWYMNMKNRFGWRDRQAGDTVSNNTENVSKDTLSAVREMVNLINDAARHR